MTPTHLGLSRREFVVHAGSAGAVAILTGCQTSREKAANLGAIDTHTHFYDPTRPQGVPWPPKDDPILYRAILPAEYRRMAEPLGIVGTVVVEASPWLEDNQWVLDLAAREPFLRGLVGHLEPGQPNFRPNLERFAANRLFRGIRIGGWGQNMDANRSAWARDLRIVADKDRAVDLLIGPEQLPMVDRLAQEIPDLRLVIDHCANVRVTGGKPPTDWTDWIYNLGKRRHVYMKVSGLVEGTGKADGTAPADTEFYRPVLDTIWNSFGPKRVIFGSNWPVSSRFASLPTVKKIVTEYFQSKGDEAARRHFRGNAATVYRFI